MSTLVFRSGDGYYSVWTCRCGCDGLVKVTGIMEHECGRSQYYYIRGHQAVGTSYEHIGARYEFVAEAIRNTVTNADVSVTPKNATTGLPGALESALEQSAESDYNDIQHQTEFDAESKTPTVHLAWWQFPNDDESP